MTDTTTEYTIHEAPMIEWKTSDPVEAERYSKAGCRVTAETRGEAV